MKEYRILVSLLACIFLLLGCNSKTTDKIDKTEELKVNREPIVLDWRTADDINVKFGVPKYELGEKLNFKGRFKAMHHNSPEVGMICKFRPRRNAAYEAGEFFIDLSLSDLVSGSDSIVSTVIAKNGIDTTERVTWEIYLKNGDTITDDILNRSTVEIEAVVEKVKRTNDKGTFMANDLVVKKIKKIESSLEKEFDLAVPLTKELGQSKDAKVYSYLEGVFNVPYSLKDLESYEFSFLQNKGFHNVMFVRSYVGHKMPGTTNELYDGFTESSVYFWDSNLNKVGCNEDVRLYGVWDGRTFILEEIVTL